MKRLLLALAAGALTFGTANAAGAPKVTIRWHGQSFFEIVSSKGTRVVTDPHLIDEFGRFMTKADVVLISHPHEDHSQLGAIENQNRAKILWGVTQGRKPDWNPVDEQFRDVHVRTVGVYHDDVQGAERGKNAVWVIRVDGLHIVHLGDLGHLLSANDVHDIGPVDVLMIPVGGVYTINGSDAKKVVEQLRPQQYIIPMHCGIANVYSDLLTADEFLEDQRNVKRFTRTNELVVEKDFKPAHPIIAVLSWHKGRGEDDK